MASVSQTSGTASLTFAELREFASFSVQEQRCIERSLCIALNRNDTQTQWAHSAADRVNLQAQTAAYRDLRSLRAWLDNAASNDGFGAFLGSLISLTAQDLARGELASFSAYRFLYERLLGAKARPWLPSAFCAAAALPHIPAQRRKPLLQSLSGAAATAEQWCEREPVFYPESLVADAA